MSSARGPSTARRCPMSGSTPPTSSAAAGAAWPPRPSSRPSAATRAAGGALGVGVVDTESYDSWLAFLGRTLNGNVAAHEPDEGDPDGERLSAMFEDGAGGGGEPPAAAAAAPP